MGQQELRREPAECQVCGEPEYIGGRVRGRIIWPCGHPQQPVVVISRDAEGFEWRQLPDGRTAEFGPAGDQLIEWAYGPIEEYAT